jgi:hypothetical protein
LALLACQPALSAPNPVAESALEKSATAAMTAKAAYDPPAP